MESLIERYDLEAYTSPENIRRIASVRYGMERAYFSRTNPFVLAKDISIETVELLSERSVDLPGIETQVEQTRDNPEGDLAPHIVGTLGAHFAGAVRCRRGSGQHVFRLKRFRLFLYGYRRPKRH